MSSGRSLTFLQSSDWHLGSALTSGGLWLTPEARAARREGREGLEEAVDRRGRDVLGVPQISGDEQRFGAA